MCAESEQVVEKRPVCWRHRFMWAAVILFAILATLGWWLERQENTGTGSNYGSGAEASVPVWALDSQRESIKKDFLTNAKLGRTVSGEYKNAPFGEILADLMGQADVPFRLTDHVASDVPLSMTIPEVPLRYALRWVFTAEAGDLAPTGQLDYIVLDGVVVITDAGGIYDMPELDRDDLFDAYRILKRTRVVGSPWVGYRSQIASDDWKTFETIARSPKATLVFVDLLEHGTPEAKAYALLGLKHVAPKRYEIEIAKVFSVEQEVTVWIDSITAKDTLKNVMEWPDPRETWRERQSD